MSNISQYQMSNIEEEEEEEMEVMKKEEAEKFKIANLPTRPNSTTLTGGKGLTANQLREKIDEYPEALRKRLNAVIKQVKENLSNIDEILLDLPKKAGEKIVGGGEIFNDYDNNEATGPNSSASGEGTIATEAGQCVVGRYNNPDKEYFKDALFVVGAGTRDTQRANAFAVLKNGRIIGGAVNIEPTAGYDVVVKAYLDKRLSALREIIDEVDKEADDASSSISRVEEKAETAIANAESASNEAAAAQKRADDAFYLAEGRSRTQVFEYKWEMDQWIDNHLITESFPIRVKANDDALVVSCEGDYTQNGDPSCVITVKDPSGVTSEMELLIERFEFKNGRSYFAFDCPDKNISGYTITNAKFYINEEPYINTETEFTRVGHNVWKCVPYIDVYEVSPFAWSPYSIKVGTNFLIRALDVPDYWWDGFNAQPLETQKVDLSGYPTEKEVKDGLQTILDALNAELGEEVTE